MLMRAKKTSRFLVLATSFSGLLSLAIAAPPAPVPSIPVPEPQATLTVPINSLAPASSNNRDSLDYLLHDKPADGSILGEQARLEQQAKMKELAQEALGFTHVSNEFVRYLETSELPSNEVKSYQDELATVQDLLRQQRTADAWKELPKLATFDRLDAGISEEIANRVQTVSDANRAMAGLDRHEEQLHSQAESIARNADMESEAIFDRQLDRERKAANNGAPNQGGGSGGGGGGGSSNQSGGTNSAPVDNSSITNAQISPPSSASLGELQITTHYLDELHTQTKIATDQYNSLHIQSVSKSEFADYIADLFKLGRFQDVIIAADFWRQIFNQGDYPVDMAEEVTESLENQSAVRSDVEAFQNSVDQNDVKAATESLQEAFRISPHDASLLAVTKAKKRSIQSFVRQLSKVQNMIEAEDFTDLESVLNDMKKTAPDFDATKAMAMVNEVKMLSKLHLGKAKLYAQENDLKSAMIEFQDAAEAWPNNPDLTSSSNSFFSTQDNENQAIAQFDHYVAEGNYAAIADNQLLLAPSLRDDPARQKQMKEMLQKALQADGALEKAKAMEEGGDVDGAWETAQMASTDLPDDVKLNSLRANLAGKAADFVSAINKAQEAENRQEYGFSLTWFAVAQQTYPASQIANSAISRISKKIMDKSSLASPDSKGATSSESPASSQSASAEPTAEPAKAAMNSSPGDSSSVQ